MIPSRNALQIRRHMQNMLVPCEPMSSNRPAAAASVAVFRDDTVLLVERGKGMGGVWSLPGGHIEFGETASAAAAREVAEETGLAYDEAGLAAVHDVILRDAAGVATAHYVIAVYFGTWRGGEPRPAGDSRSARFVPIADLPAMTLTEGARAIILRAAGLLRALEA